MATVILAGTVVLAGAVISTADGDNVLSSAPSGTSSSLTGIDLNETLGLYSLTSVSAPFSLTEQTTVMVPIEDVNGNPLTWSYQIVSSSGATHEVQFVAEDGNGNSAALTFVFESPSVSPVATVVEAFSVSQTSSSFLVTPPIVELPEISSTIAVGAMLEDANGTNTGSVYVYDASDLSATPTKISPPLPSGNAGSSISLNNSGYLFIGAYGDDTTASNSGAVFVYSLSDPSTLQKKLTPSQTLNTSVGFRVKATDTHLLVGAHNDPSKGTNSGSVYVYDISDLDAEPVRLCPTNITTNDQFGKVLHIDNNNVYAYSRNNSSGNSYLQAVYVYSLSNLSATPIKLVGSTPHGGFGSSITTDENNLYIGETGINGGRGAVNVYDLNDLSASPTIISAPSDIPANSMFGYSMDVDNGTLIVGANQEYVNGFAYQGAVYVYDTNDLSASPLRLLSPDDGDTETEFFGAAVSISPDTVTVGAWYDSNRQGHAFVFNRYDLSEPPTKLTAFDGGYDDRFGWSVDSI